MNLLFVGYAVATVGLVVAGAAVALQSSRAISFKVANVQFVKMVTAKNLDRALKLTHAGNPTTYLRAIEAAILAGGRAGTTDSAVLAPTIQTAFDEAGRPRAQMWRRLATIGLAGCVVAVAGAAMAVAIGGLGKHGGGTAGLGVGAMALFLGFGFASRFGQVDAALADARHKVLPLVVDAFAGGATLRPEDHGGA
jgi:hypothetical protein